MLCFREPPNILVFLSYIFYFQGILVGPLCFYADYISFIEGENFRVPKSNESQQNSEKESLIANGDKVCLLFDILYCQYIPTDMDIS